MTRFNELCRTGAQFLMHHAFRTGYRRATLIGIGFAFIIGFAMPAQAATTAGSHTGHGIIATGVAAPLPAPVPDHHSTHGSTHNVAPKRAFAGAHEAAPKTAPAPMPTMKQLMPRGEPGDQSSIKTTASQMKNAKAIVEAGKKLHLSPRAWVIAVATSLQETKLHNYGSLGANNDHDSLGLFQQRPSSGWGSPKEITNPNYAATKFYKALTHVHGWQKLPLTVAAQKVQVSAFGDRYAQWENQAAHLVMASVHQGA
jgi:hypothetical protein